MQTFETAAVISLIDHLSGPLSKLASHVGNTGTVFDKHAEKLTKIGKSLTYGVTLPLFEVGKHMMDHALEFSKVENTLQGVLENRARTMKGLTQTNEEYARSQRRLIDTAAEAAYRSSGGQSSVFDFHKSAMAGVKAGFDTDASNAIATSSVNLALAGRIEQSEATDQLITLANSFGVKLKDAQGHSLPTAQLNRAFGSMSDLLATMSTNANMTEHDAFESLKLSAPLARYTKLSPGQLGAIQESLAESGFKGSEAGVAMRSMELAFTGPKSTAVPMLRDAGVDINKFRSFKPDYDMGPEHFEKYIRGFNYKVSDAQVKEAYRKAHEAADKSNGALTYQGALPDYLSPIIRSAGKKQQPVAPNVAQKRVMDFISAGAETIDMFGAILEMREKHLTSGQLKKFMEGRQIPRAMGILATPEAGANDPFDIAMKRNFGDDWKDQVEKLRAAGKSWNDIAKYFENASRLAKHHAEDIEGSYRHIEHAWEHLEYRLYKAGAFDAAARGIEHLASLVDKFANQSPGMQRFEVGALALAAGLGPLLLLTGKMLQAGKALTVLADGVATMTGLKSLVRAAAPAAEAGGMAGAAARGAAAAGTVEGAVVSTGAAVGGAAIAAGVAAAGALMAGAAYWQYKHPEQFYSAKFGGKEGFLKRFETHDRVGGDGIILHHGDDYGPHRQMASSGRYGTKWELAPGDSIGGGHANIDAFLNAATKALKAIVPEAHVDDTRHGGSPYGALVKPENITVAPSRVEGDVKGEATLMQTIKVEPSPLLIATIQGAQQALRMNLNGKLGQTMKGSNATVSSVAPGLSSFKPTMSGR